MWKFRIYVEVTYESEGFLLILMAGNEWPLEVTCLTNRCVEEKSTQFIEF